MSTQHARLYGFVLFKLTREVDYLKSKLARVKLKALDRSSNDLWIIRINSMLLDEPYHCLHGYRSFKCLAMFKIVVVTGVAWLSSVSAVRSMVHSSN